VVLEELAAQLAAIGIKAAFQLIVGESRRLGVPQEPDEALVERVRRAEDAARSFVVRCDQRGEACLARASRAPFDSR
jgi:hypothetical protein